MQVVAAEQSAALLVAAANVTDGRVFPDYSLCAVSTSKEPVHGGRVPATSLNTVTGANTTHHRIARPSILGLTVRFDCRTVGKQSAAQAHAAVTEAVCDVYQDMRCLLVTQ